MDCNVKNIRKRVDFIRYLNLYLQSPVITKGLKLLPLHARPVRSMVTQAANNTMDQPPDRATLLLIQEKFLKCGAIYRIAQQTQQFEVIFLKDSVAVESGKRFVNRFQRTYANRPPNSSLETSSTHLYLQYPQTSIKPLSNSYSYPDNSLYIVPIEIERNFV